MAFPVFSGDQKYGIDENNFGKKVFWLSILFQPKLAKLQQVATLIGTGGGLSRWTRDNMALWTTNNNHNLYEDFKWFAEVALRNISKWRCS